MFKKVVVLFLCFVCVSTFANTKNEFKLAVDSLNYDLSVEWDQNDKVAYDKYMENFQKKFELMMGNGLTEKEIKEAINEMIKDPSQKADFEIRANLLKFNDGDDIGTYVWEKRESLYSQGSSWLGGIAAGELVIGILLAGVLAAGIYYLASTEYVCTQKGPYACRTESYCPSDSKGPSNTCKSWRTREICEEPCLEGYRG